MRPDKSEALRARLRKGASSFDFDALIQGVSTEDDATEAGALDDAISTPTSVDDEIIPIQIQDTTVADDGQLKGGLVSALETLGVRLLEETGKLRSALQASDASDGGYYLARVNNVLELLETVDPAGETSRRYATPAAPPPGRVWPRPCWSVYEFTESPISGLLAADADLNFVGDLIESAISSPDG
ncbi:MAG: hypothetical protein HUU17_07770 [Chthonomonadales bacterium]|nr:hypothetical protein [Chthonomonadales bacterium]